MKKIIFLLLLLPVIMAGQVVGYYPLNGDANDYSGQADNGTATNVTYADGKCGQSAYFNGSSSKVELPLANAFPVGASARTINVWTRQNTFTGQNYYVFFNYGEPSGAQGFMAHNQVNSGRTTSKPRIYTGSYSQMFGSSPSIDSLRWHMVTVIVPAGADSVNDILLYRDGIAASSYTTVNGLLNTTQTTTAPKIGYRTSGSYYYKGFIDELWIDSRAWTAAEVKNKYAFYQGFYSN